MKIMFSAVLSIALLFVAVVANARRSLGVSSLQPPMIAPVRPVVDHYYGTKVEDRYRYIENLQDPLVQSWFKSQNDYAGALLARIPGRQKVLDRITELDRKRAPFRVGTVARLPSGVYVYPKHLASETVDKLYVRNGLSGFERQLIDPEQIALIAPNHAKGRNVISGFAVSDDSKYIAVGITPGGAEADTELHVIDLSSGRDTGETLWGGIGAEAWTPNWLPDGHSFIYGRLQKLPPGAPLSETRQKYRAYLHVLGSDPKMDRAVFGYDVTPSIPVDPSLIASIRTTPGSPYALGILNGSTTRNSVFYCTPSTAIGRSDLGWRKIADFSDDVTDVAAHGEDLYLLTYKNAPRFKIIRTNAANPNLASAEPILTQSDGVIRQMSAAQDALYVVVADGVTQRLLRVSYGANPNVETLTLPVEGRVDLFGVDPRVPGTLIDVGSWTRSGTLIYAYDPQAKRFDDTKLQPAGPYDLPENIKSVEVKARSYDGTLIPLSIVYPKTLKLNGSNPTELYGYGAYGSSEDPGFSPFLLAWYERQGVHAVCHVRGGGEYGEDWHLAGKGANKRNTWLDFIACAQYLIDEKYTSPAFLAARGVSAGGILVGRAITERPDLFGAAWIDVGVLDTLRSETTANGATNIPELGSTKTKEGFEALYAMSSYHHVKDHTRYPAVLLETGMNDPRVEPWESAKMTARLQAATNSGKPNLLRVNYTGGHGSVTIDQFEEDVADAMSFFLWQFGDPNFQSEP